MWPVASITIAMLAWAPGTTAPALADPCALVSKTEVVAISAKAAVVVSAAKL